MADVDPRNEKGINTTQRIIDQHLF